MLLDGDRTVWDSLGITLYLAEAAPGVWPEDESGTRLGDVRGAEMHGGFGALRAERTMNIGCESMRSRRRPAWSAMWRGWWNCGARGCRASRGPWLAGEHFSAVDAFFAPVAFRVRTYGIGVGAAGAPG